MKILHIITWVLIIVGAVNWGLVGLGGFMGGDWNIVHKILGSMPSIEWIVYILVGLSAVYEIATHWKHCKMCGSGGMGMPSSTM